MIRLVLRVGCGIPSSRTPRRVGAAHGTSHASKSPSSERRRVPVTLFRIGAFAFGALALALAAVLILGYLLPATWTVERTVVIRAEPDAIFSHLDRAEAWEAWTPGPETGYELFGPDGGQGSGRRWDDPGYGQGRFVIREVEPHRTVRYQVEVEEGAIVIQGSLELVPVDDGTTVQWREVGDFGWNPLLGFLAGRMEELQGAQLEASLEALKELVEGEVHGPGSAEGGQPGRGNPQRFARLS